MTLEWSQTHSYIRARSQTSYLFTCGGTKIYWLSIKQTLVVVSTNHAQIISNHEARHTYIWL